MAISKKQRKAVLAKSAGHCWYCGDKLPENGWHVDHVEPVRREIKSGDVCESPFGEVPESIKKLLDDGRMASPENDKIENMVPSCAPCNLFKGVFSVDQFRQEIALQITRARKRSVNFRTAERFGMLSVNTEPIVFWCEKQGA